MLVWSLCYFMIHGLGGLDEVANGLAAAPTYANQIEERSSQLLRNLSNCEKKA